jgi:transcriptional regulator with XRE-family HTH domain
MDNVMSLMIDKPCKLTGQPKAEEVRNTHRGKIVEFIVRRHPLGLSEISRKVGVSRRTLYNWFENEKLSMNDIKKIGVAIDYDFSKELPVEIYENSLSNLKYQETKALSPDTEYRAVYYWMEKYIRLLEQYNEILNCKMDKSQS